MKKIKLTIVGLLILSIYACSKSSSSSSSNADVYVAGFDNGNLVYWKNGSEIILGTAALGITGMLQASL